MQSREVFDATKKDTLGYESAFKVGRFLVLLKSLVKKRGSFFQAVRDFLANIAVFSLFLRNERVAGYDIIYS